MPLTPSDPLALTSDPDSSLAPIFLAKSDASGMDDRAKAEARILGDPDRDAMGVWRGVGAGEGRSMGWVMERWRTPSIHWAETWERSSTRKSGFSASSDARECDVHVARTIAPDARPDRIPVGASSTTTPVGEKNEEGGGQERARRGERGPK